MRRDGSARESQNTSAHSTPTALACGVPKYICVFRSIHRRYTGAMEHERLWKDRIVADSTILCGKPTIKGTRISVQLIVSVLARGWTTEQILHEYDHLTTDDIRACLAYAADALRSGDDGGGAAAST
jgi:uncharacterized protein (DUF433 family)